ncbi:protein YhfH [Bacillus sp. B15-48]|nr:protein YhfH [Bacillus sp. B15-48]MBM4762680.1 YhfH family protein [Bacillus sp. B15-48]
MIQLNPTIKECRECGSQFKEKHESLHFECEHCMSKHEE